MSPDPLLLAVTLLLGRARQRARAALQEDPEAGAISLEWIVIAGILVAAATAAGVFFFAKLKHWEAKVP
jgi:hypothetical protein